MKSRINIIPIMIFCFSLIFTCCKKQVKEETKIPVDKKIEVVTPEDDEIPKEYLKEGFVSKDTFRVVILSTKDDCESNVDEIRKKAEKRAEVTLQKYLISVNKVVDQNARAEILKLINENGDFSKRDEECKKNNVFFFDIKKKLIKNQVEKFGTER